MSFNLPSVTSTPNPHFVPSKPSLSNPAFDKILLNGAKRALFKISQPVNSPAVPRCVLFDAK